MNRNSTFSIRWLQKCGKGVAGDAFAFLNYQRRYWYHGYQYIGKAIGLDVNNALTGGLTMERAGYFFMKQIV